MNAKNQYDANTAYFQAVIDRLSNIKEFEGSPSIRDYFAPAAGVKRPVIFATAHWGSYLRCFNLIGNSFPAGSRFVTLRGEDWSDREGELWAEINRRSSSSIYVHRVFDRGSLLRVVRDLREGVNAFILFDLFEKYGRTGPIEVFDWTLHVANRWIDMAYSTGAIVCILKPASIKRDEIIIHEIIDSNGFSKAADFLGICTSACAKCLEDLILEDPDYWFMWEDLERLLTPPGPV